MVVKILTHHLKVNGIINWCQMGFHNGRRIAVAIEIIDCLNYETGNFKKEDEYDLACWEGA